MPGRVVVVGASAAGLATVEALRKEGFDGELTLIGAELHAPYDRPPLSKQILSGVWEPGRTTLRAAADLARLQLDLRLGTTATGLDLASRTITLSDGSRADYDRLVIATGVHARRLPGMEGLTGIQSLRTLEDALDLRERLVPGSRLVVLGAGFLGTEVATAARLLGVEVVLVEPEPVPLARTFGAQVGELLAKTHRDHGVEVRTGVLSTGFLSAGGSVTGVSLIDGSVLKADTVLVAVGSIPATGWLESSGLRIDDGVVCDRYCAAAPGVFCAGDVARWYNPAFGMAMRVEHRTNATEQGVAVARNLLTPGAFPFAHVPYFWSHQYDLMIQAYGSLREHDEFRVVDGDLGGRRFVGLYRRADRLIGAIGINMPKAIHRWRSVIAAGMSWETALVTDGAMR